MKDCKPKITLLVEFCVSEKRAASDDLEKYTGLPSEHSQGQLDISWNSPEAQSHHPAQHSSAPV